MSGRKIQSHVPDYHEYVISKLIGIEGTSVSDVIARIIGFWIEEHKDDLSDLGISKKSWLNRNKVSDNVINYADQRRTSKNKS